MPDNINWGLLANQAPQIQSAQPKATPAPAPSSGGGGGGGGGRGLGGLLGGIGSLFGGGGGASGCLGGSCGTPDMGGATGLQSQLQSLFGSNPVSTANQALSTTMQGMDPHSLSANLMGASAPQGLGQSGGGIKASGGSQGQQVPIQGPGGQMTQQMPQINNMQTPQIQPSALSANQPQQPGQMPLPAMGQMYNNGGQNPSQPQGMSAPQVPIQASGGGQGQQVPMQAGQTPPISPLQPNGIHPSSIPYGQDGQTILSQVQNNQKGGAIPVSTTQPNTQLASNNAPIGTPPLSPQNATLGDMLQHPNDPSIQNNMQAPSFPTGGNSKVTPQMVNSPIQNITPSLPNSSGTSNTSTNPYSVENMQKLAEQTFPGDPIRQQLAVAQATEESNLLKHPSGLATKQNNLFGMTGQGTAGSRSLTGNLDTHAQTFAAYNNPQESFDAYKHTLSNPRYADVMKATNFNDAANAVAKGGYATDPRYADNLKDVHNQLSQQNSMQQASNMAKVPGSNPLDVANAYMGLGRQNHPEALQNFFQKSMGQKVDIQNTPYCAAFANSVLSASGHGGTGSLAAKSFLGYGKPTSNPSSGDVVVLNRGNNPNLGHVGFFQQFNQDHSMVQILSGNGPGGKVGSSWYPTSHVAGYRVPPNSQELGNVAKGINNNESSSMGNPNPASQGGLLTNPMSQSATMQQTGATAPIQQQSQGQQKQQSPQNSPQASNSSQGQGVLSRNLVQEASAAKAQKKPTQTSSGGINWGMLSV